MALEDEMAVGMAEDELLLRRNHLRMVADDLAERIQWLDTWLPEDSPSVLPPNDWPEHLSDERSRIVVARAALHERRVAQMRAEDAALLVWQMMLDAVADETKTRERAHKQQGPKSRVAGRRTQEAPHLSLGDRPPPEMHADNWRATVEMPQARIAPETVIMARGPTISMTPAEQAAADETTLPRAAKRRTGRLTPFARRAGPNDTESQDPPADQRDLVPLATPYDLPTVAPAPATPRHRARAVTEPFVAALDLDGLYLKRDQVVLDAGATSIHVRLDNDARYVERENMPAEPQRMTYRSREGDTLVFPVRDVQTQVDGDGPRLLLDVQHWSPDDLAAFRRALESLP